MFSQTDGALLLLRERESIKPQVLPDVAQSFKDALDGYEKCLRELKDSVEELENPPPNSYSMYLYNIQLPIFKTLRQKRDSLLEKLKSINKLLPAVAKSFRNCQTNLSVKDKKLSTCQRTKEPKN